MTAKKLWTRWVVANGIAELVGLTSTMALAAGAFAVNDNVSLGVGLLIALGVAALGAVIEGVAVGGLQWRVARDVLPELPLRDWILATSIGAFAAWSLGMLPSTLLSSAAAATGSAEPVPFEPALWVQLLLAAAMGLVLGPVLGVPQWQVLKRTLPRAGWWVLANANAWALGMPMIFLATSFIAAGDPPWLIASYVAAGCLTAGLVVGAVHGAWLVWLLGRAGRLSA